MGLLLLLSGVEVMIVCLVVVVMNATWQVPQLRWSGLMLWRGGGAERGEEKKRRRRRRSRRLKPLTAEGLCTSYPWFSLVQTGAGEKREMWGDKRQQGAGMRRSRTCGWVGGWVKQRTTPCVGEGVL